MKKAKPADMPMPPAMQKEMARAKAEHAAKPTPPKPARPAK